MQKTPTSTAPAARGTNPQPLHAAEIADALLTLRTAQQVSGLSAATLYRKAKSDPTFPKLVKMGKRCTRIRAGELTAWLAAQGVDVALPAAKPATKKPGGVSAWHAAIGGGAA